MPDLHRFIGFFVVGLFAVGWIWGLGAKLLRRGPGEWFWRWLAVVQVTIAVQVVVGAILFASGSRAPVLLHYAYGIFPVILLVIAHGVARRPQYRVRPWVPFAWAAFFCFGLTLRAVMTGLGMS